MRTYTNEEVTEIEESLKKIADSLYKVGGRLGGSPEANEVWNYLNQAWERTRAALHSMYRLRPTV
jgi:hypothetical protein